MSICRCDCHSNCRVLVLGSLSRRFHQTLILTLEWILKAINCKSVLGVLRAGGQWVATRKKVSVKQKMELSDEPKSWVEEARNRVKRISDLDPRDRLDIVYGIGLCCSTLAKSMQGWMQWIGNLSLKDFEQRELEEIFGIIKKATVQLMELDIDKTSKYEESHGLRQKPGVRENRLVS